MNQSLIGFIIQYEVREEYMGVTLSKVFRKVGEAIGSQTLSDIGYSYIQKAMRRHDMENVMCMLEGALQENDLATAGNIYREHKDVLPIQVCSAIEQELFKRDLEKGVLKIRNKENGRVYHVQQFHNLFKKEGL